MGRAMTGFRLIIAAVLLAGCTGNAVPAPNISFVKLPDGIRPPNQPNACWAFDTTPAVIETVIDQIQIRPEQRDPTGMITRPAQFQTKTAQKMVQDRETVWFRVPCPDTVDVAFVASLQRALKARGRFSNPITGAYDTITAESVRKFQAEKGLDSAILTLDAARDLGLSAQDRS